jgi:multiple sugar transport system substrate-binding protein
MRFGAAAGALLLVALVATMTAATSAAKTNKASVTTLSMWSRAAASAQVQVLVDAFNKTHTDTQVALTPIPDAQFVAKFAAAARSGDAPDLVSTDLVYMPRFASSGLFTDLTDRVNALPYGKSLTPGQVALGRVNNKTYAVPEAVDVSSLFYNKDLFRRAGLNPNKPPTTLAELAQDAKKITALGHGISGYYFSAGCAGCNAFTFLPMIWASGGDVLSKDQKSATFDSPAVRNALGVYRQMWQAGSIAKAAKTDSGEHFVDLFASGKIGMQGIGAFAISGYKHDHPNLHFGVAPLPGLHGGRSAFVGGDMMGIPSGSQHVDEAWSFISYALSADVQLNSVAKSGGLVVRTDLANNIYSRKDPRTLLSNQLVGIGRVPKVLPYNEIFNDANGPWLAMIRRAVFTGDTSGAIADAQKQVNALLKSSG